MGAALFLSGCRAANTNNKEPEAPKDGPTAALFSSLAQIWTPAGGPVDITVGESADRGFASSSAILVDEGSGHAHINTELLISSRPGLVIGTADYPCQAEAVDLCSRAGIRAKTCRVESLEDYLSVLREFCALTGHPENYETYGTAVEQACGEVLKNSRENSAYGTVRYLFLRAGSTARSTKIKTAADVFACGMADELGGINVAGTELGADQLSLEEILRLDPDVILVSPMGSEEASVHFAESLFAKDGWAQLSAVKEGRVYYLDKELFHYKPNQRWAESYRVLSEILYGERP